MVIEGKALFPCRWYEHTEASLENRYCADVLQIRFKDLFENPARELERFCEFAGIERYEEMIQRAVSGNSFSWMQQKEK